jgi:capsular polysaccharide biosynthesis protein
MMTTPHSRFLYSNPLELPRISYDDIVQNRAEGVYVEQPEQVRSFSGAPPAFHDDPDRAQLFPAFHEITVTYPPVFTASLRDATVLGFRTVLSSDGFFINDIGYLDTTSLRDFATGLAKSEELTKLAPTDAECVFFRTDGGQPEVHLEGPVVLLTSAEPGNFGSFLYRDLPKLVNLINIPATWRFLAHVPGKTYEEFLQLAGIPMERVIPHDLYKTYVIEQAIIPGLRTPLAFADKETRAFYDMLRSRCDTGERGRRIYVSRSSVSAARPTARVMQNEGVLIERLHSLGFDIIEPQFLSASQQIGTFAAADFVLGPSGAGMFNVAFCTPGTTVIDIESEPHWIYPHTCLFASAGLHYGIFEGLASDRDWSVHHKPWSANVDALLQRIAMLQDRTTNTFAPGPFAPGTDAAGAGVEQPFWSTPDLGGEDYKIVLQRFHQAFKPQSYLEIGVADGATLELAECFSIGVDPRFAIDRPITKDKSACCLFQMTSDNFFQNANPSAIFGRPVDMAFLDGMHLFEFLLRDFINVERHCKQNSIIFIHDCLPTDQYVGRREVNDHALKTRSRHQAWWTGDVWKVLEILTKYRADLRVVIFNAFPTGLVAVTRLDPSSTLLADRYFDLVTEYKNRELIEHGNAFYQSITIFDTRDYSTFESMSGLFWM